MRAWCVMGLMAVFAVRAAAQAPAELKVGDTAPDFSLQGTDGKTHRLSEYRGKKAVVLAWFPKAFTQGCTIECKSLAATGEKIRKYDVAYFMASVDPLEGAGGNLAFAKSENADFPLLSDPTKDTATRYGVLNTQRGFANRWTFYIDRSGTIAYIDKAVRPATSAEDMLARMDELKIAHAQ
jgi:thioredoxin-dependent peroxiredoxin